MKKQTNSSKRTKKSAKKSERLTLKDVRPFYDMQGHFRGLSANIRDTRSGEIWTVSWTGRSRNTSSKWASLTEQLRSLQELAAIVLRASERN